MNIPIQNDNIRWLKIQSAPAAAAARQGRVPRWHWVQFRRVAISSHRVRSSTNEIRELATVGRLSYVFLWVSCCFTRSSRISPKFCQNFTGITRVSPELCQNIELEHLKKEDNHNSAFPHLQPCFVCLFFDLDRIPLCETCPCPSSSHPESNPGPLGSETECSTTRMCEYNFGSSYDLTRKSQGSDCSPTNRERDRV